MSGHGAEHLAVGDDPVVRRERGSLPAVGGGSMGRRGDDAPHVGCGAVAADHRGLGGRADASPGHGQQLMDCFAASERDRPRAP